MNAAETPEALDIFVSWGGAVLILFAIISGITAFSVWLGRHMDKRIAGIAEQLDRRTQPIQSGYENDGNSLTDISNSVHELSDKVDNVSNRLDDHASSEAHNRRRDDKEK